MTLCREEPVAVPKTSVTSERPREDSRADLVRVLRTQVRTGRYRTEPEALAEQLLAWFGDVSD